MNMSSCVVSSPWHLPSSYRDDLNASPVGGGGTFQSLTPAVSPLSVAYNGYLKDTSPCSLLSASNEHHGNGESAGAGGCAGLESTIGLSLANPTAISSPGLDSNRKVLTNLDTYRDTYKDAYSNMKDTYNNLNLNMKDASSASPFSTMKDSYCNLKDAYSFTVKDSYRCSSSPLGLGQGMHPPHQLGHGHSGLAGPGHHYPHHPSSVSGFTSTAGMGMGVGVGVGVGATHNGSMGYPHGAYNSGSALTSPGDGAPVAVPSSPSAGTTFPSNSCMYSPWGSHTGGLSNGGGGGGGGGGGSGPGGMSHIHGHGSPPGVGAASSVPIKPSPVVMTTSTAVSLPSSISSYSIKGEFLYIMFSVLKYPEKSPKLSEI